MTEPKRVTVLKSAVERLILAADMYGVAHLDSDDMDDDAVELQDATESMKDILAAAPSEQPEPVAWRPMDEAPQGCVTEEAGIRGASKWFIGRPSAEFRNCSPAFVVIRRRAWPHEDAWQGHGEVDYVPRYFDAWRPLYAQPSEQTGAEGEYGSRDEALLRGLHARLLRTAPSESEAQAFLQRQEALALWALMAFATAALKPVEG